MQQEKDIYFKHKQFIIKLNNYLQDDRPNGPFRRRYLKKIADHINDFPNDQNAQFFYNQWYLMALDIIKAKLFKEPEETIKKSIPKYRYNLTFTSKAFNFTNLPKTLRSKEVCDNTPSKFDISDICMVLYNLNPFARSTLFNYK